MEKYGVVLMVALVFVIGAGLGSMRDKNPPKEQPQFSPCECLNYYQWTYWSTKRDRVLNKLKRTHTDSLELRNADRILGIDETQNVYPPR